MAGTCERPTGVRWRRTCALMGAAALVVTLTSCAASSPRQAAAGQAEATQDTPKVVTADIAAGIEHHIEEQQRVGEGHFQLEFGDQELRLQLVRVHMEYLANLGPRRHFACVDLVDVSGDVYDVDFFLAGDPGAMTVTETTVHKINGRPYYLWKQKPDRTWHRIEVELASPRDLGVVPERDAFTFRYAAELPEIGEAGRMWIPLPESDAFQTVTVESIAAPGTQRMLRDRGHGNRVLLLELGPQASRETVEIVFRVERREKAVYPARASEEGDYLRPDRLIPLDDRIARIARRAIEGRKTDLMRARALYDHVIESMRYMKHGDYGRGDAVYACDAGTGNCTEYHSYFIALARSIGIPARFSIGASIPSERDRGGIDGYHCWAEFYADGKWWPIDISEADKYSSLATYYFGHHPANRFELSRGRDLVVEPGPKSGPINFLAYPVLEIGGEPAQAKVEFSFERG